MTDETSKFGSKYMGYEAADSQELFGADNNNETSKNIIKHIVATMSDRAATKVKFNTLLHDFRKEVLPLAIENYDAFSEMLAFGEDTHIDRDAIFNALLTPDGYDNCTEVLLATFSGQTEMRSVSSQTEGTVTIFTVGNPAYPSNIVGVRQPQQQQQQQQRQHVPYSDRSSQIKTLPQMPNR
ncbi:hypothetical protein MAR_004897, partial [Mya arenaria]